MYKIILLTIFLSIFSSNAQVISSEESMKIEKIESGKFDRRSVTIIPLAKSDIADIYASEMIDAAIGMNQSPRFDLNIISKDKMNKAILLFKKSNFNFDKMDSKDNVEVLIGVLKESGCLSDIVDSMSNISTLVERIRKSKKRINTSALEQMGINAPTVGEMKILFNGTYIGIPVLKTIEGGQSEAKAEGYIYWLKINVDEVSDWNGTTPNVEQLKITLAKSGESKQSVKTETKVGLFDLPDFSSALEWDAELEKEKELPIKNRAVRKFVKSSQKLALDMDDFRIRGTIQDVNDGIRVDVGLIDGAYLDQGYKVYELQIDENNKISSKYIGFGRLSKVANNIEKFDALSNMYSIIGSYEQGHIISSWDRGFDIKIQPFYRIVNIPKGFNRLIGFANSIYDKDVSGTLGAEVSIFYNLARIIKITQFFGGVTFSVGLPLAKPEPEYIAVTPIIMEGSVSLLKKFWFSRMNFFLQIDGGISKLMMSGETKRGEKWEVATGFQFGIGGSAGIEMALNADLNLGFDIGYKYVLKPSTIDVTIGSNETSYLESEIPELWKAAGVNNLKLGGMRFGLRVTYSLPVFF